MAPVRRAMNRIYSNLLGRARGRVHIVFTVCSYRSSIKGSAGPRSSSSVASERLNLAGNENGMPLTRQIHFRVRFEMRGDKSQHVLLYPFPDREEAECAERDSLSPGSSCKLAFPLCDARIIWDAAVFVLLLHAFHQIYL